METNFKSSAYFKALTSKPLKDIKMNPSERQQAMISQKKKCIKCKKELRPFLHSYVKDSVTGKMTVICSDCKIPMPSKRR